MPCRIAVVGAGPLVGLQHCHIINDLPDVELACVCQRRADDKELADTLGVPLYTDAFDMAFQEHLDGVVIAAPTHLHLPVAKACIAGAKKRQAALGESSLGLRALLVEKPLCENLEAAVELVMLAQEAGVEILAGHQRRHSSFVKKARSLVTDRNFGPLRGVTVEFSLLKPDGYFSKENPKLEWRRQKGKGGPLLINMIHDIDLLRYITGHEITQVFAMTSSAARGNAVEDSGAITVTFDHGAVGSLFFTDAAPSPWSYEFTTGENKKYAPVPGTAARDCYHFMGAQRSLGFPSLCDYSYSPEVKVKGWDASLTVESHDVNREDPLRVQMEHFVKVCLGEERPICPGRDAVESLAVVMAVIRSAETGTSVQPGDLFREVTLKQAREAGLEVLCPAGLSVDDPKYKKGSYSYAEATTAGFTKLRTESVSDAPRRVDSVLSELCALESPDEAQ